MIQEENVFAGNLSIFLKTIKNGINKALYKYCLSNDGYS